MSPPGKRPAHKKRGILRGGLHHRFVHHHRPGGHYLLAAGADAGRCRPLVDDHRRSDSDLGCIGYAGVKACSMSGSLMARLRVKGLGGAFLLGLAYGVLSGSCTFGLSHRFWLSSPYNKRSPPAFCHRAVRHRALYPYCRGGLQRGPLAPRAGKQPVSARRYVVPAHCRCGDCLFGRVFHRSALCSRRLNRYGIKPHCIFWIYGVLNPVY